MIQYDKKSPSWFKMYLSNSFAKLNRKPNCLRIFGQNNEISTTVYTARATNYYYIHAMCMYYSSLVSLG